MFLSRGALTQPHVGWHCHSPCFAAGKGDPSCTWGCCHQVGPPLEQLLLQDPYVLCLCFFWKTTAFFPGRGRGWCKVSPPLSPAPACPAPAHSARTPLTQVLSASVVAAHSGFGCSPCIPSRLALPWAQAKTCCYRSEQPGATALQLYQPSQPYWSLCAEMLALSPPLEAALPYAVLERSVSWLYPHCSAHEFSGGRNTAQPLGQMQMAVHICEQPWPSVLKLNWLWGWSAWLWGGALTKGRWGLGRLQVPL